MRFSMVPAILIALCLASLTVKSHGELIMIRHPSKTVNGVKRQDLTCMSEKNVSALVWNRKLNDGSDDTSFPRYYKKFDNCAHGEICFRLTNGEGWDETSSIDSPMGPVYDFRWEDFDNYNKSRKYLDRLKESGTIVFSARGSEDLHLRFGEEKTNGSCFRITFAASDQNTSGIRACNDQGSDPGRLNGTLISLFEWRTYIIKWNGNDKIEVKKPRLNRKSAAENIMEKKVNSWINVTSLVVENPDSNWIRFHIYNYSLSTMVDKCVTTSPFIKTMALKDLHIELVVSLCSECHLTVQVTDGNPNPVIKDFIYGDNKLPAGELPVWRIKRFKLPLRNTSDGKPLSLKMVTGLSGTINGTDGKGRWAIDKCLIYNPQGELRESTRTFDILSNEADFPCQEISDDDGKRSVVHSNGRITHIDSASLDQCLNGARKSCDLRFCGGSCKGTSICNSKGCTCASGFQGENCTQECPDGNFGYNCQRKCDIDCKKHKCDKIKGCSQSECLDYYVPPKCEKEMKVPRVRCISETGVQLSHTMDLDKEDVLRFEITKTDSSTDPVKSVDEWERVDLIQESTSAWHLSDESIGKLEPMKNYSVRAVVNETTGPRAVFDTGCWKISEPQNVSLIARENGNMTLKWSHNPRFWESIKRFEVSVEVLNSTLGRDPAMHNLSMTTNSSKGQNVKLYQVQLQLLPLNNYTFTIRARDENHKKSRAIRLWYLIPDDVTFERSEEKLPNSTMRRISFKLPAFANLNATEEGISYVIMKRSYTCPILGRDLTSVAFINMSEANFSRPDSSEEGEYPACRLRSEETYLFTVSAPVDDWRAFLSWVVSVSVSALCCLTFYYLYWKHKHVRSASIKSPLITYAKDTNSDPINELEESLADCGVPSEMQKLRSFENYIRRATENGVLHQQFMSLPKGLVRPCDYGRLPDNKPKNRYGNLIAYDDTRVILMRDSRGVHSDYINANYVQGYCKEKAYIATQGPLPETVIDFWRMIWQEEVRVICMLVDLVESGKHMCEQYWPEVGEKIQYGDIVILTTNQRVFADFTYRTFLVSNSRGSESQTVEHLQYTAWPDEGIPMYSHSVVEFLQKLLSVPPGQGPVVVHCSSGTGRTGVIILADICWRYLAAEGTVDVFAEAKKMYDARANMLRNFSQYVLVHLVPTQCLIMLPTKILCPDVTQQKIEEMKKDLPTHVARLADCSWMDKALRPLEPLRPPVAENILKNRFTKLTPVGPSLVTLTRYPTYDDNSYYISAVSVDGVKIRKQYIASQLPMPSTLTDFWRLIVEKNVELIIILQEPDSEDDTCCDIIPRGTTVIPVPHLKVETKTSSNRNEHFTTDKLLLTDTSQNLTRSKIITTMTCNNWSLKEVARPPAPESLVELWRASERIKRDGPTLVLCYDGITACGLYMTLSFMLERMSVEQECDVILAVRAVRRSRPEFMGFQWQFEYLYDAAVKYAESFQEYGNFTRSLRITHRCE